MSKGASVVPYCYSLPDNCQPRPQCVEDTVSVNGNSFIFEQREKCDIMPVLAEREGGSQIPEARGHILSCPAKCLEKQGF